MNCNDPPSSQGLFIVVNRNPRHTCKDESGFSEEAENGTKFGCLLNRGLWPSNISISKN